MTTRRLQWLTVVALGTVVLWGVFRAGSTGDPAMRLAADIACPVCAGESVAASQTDVARDMLDIIRTKQAAGESDDQIVAWFVDRFGPEVDLRPGFDAAGLALWSIPVVVAVAGAVVIRRVSRPTEQVSTEEPPLASPLPTAEAPPVGTLNRRTLIGLGVVAVGVVAGVFALGQFLQPRIAGTPVSGEIAAPVDLASISNETLAATIERFADDPDVPANQLNGMRLALAERHFESGDYRAASEVFRQVLDNEPEPAQASEALGRLGWILWVNDEPAAAESAFTQAEAAFPANAEVKYFHALMLLELDRGTEAVPLLEALVDDPTVPEDLRGSVDEMLDAARSGT